MRNIFIAIKFLTGISIGIMPTRDNIKAKELAASMSFFSIVGALIGGALALIYYLLGFFAPDKPLVLAAAVLTASIILTGGLHLNGLLKTAGPLAAPCILIAKFALIGTLTRANALAAIILSVACARTFIVLSGKFYPPARQDSAMRQLSEFLGLRETVLSIVSITVLCIVLAGLKGWMALIISFLFLLMSATYITRRIGGQTTDALGAINEITEVIFLFLFILIP